MHAYHWGVVLVANDIPYENTVRNRFEIELREGIGVIKSISFCFNMFVPKYRKWRPTQI